MKVFRIARKKYIRDLTGTGAMRHGGRWNPKGLAMIYAAESKSLAALEILVHLDKNTVPDDLQILTLEVPDDAVIEFDIKAYNSIKKSDRGMSKYKEEGKRWVESGASLCLKVPTVLMPGEWNLLLNPDHKRASEIKTLEVEDFKFDFRFFL